MEEETMDGILLSSHLIGNHPHNSSQRTNERNGNSIR